MRALAILVLLAGVANAQPSDPPMDPATALRAANDAANAGDWPRVSAYVQPLLARQLDRADLAEAHRLAGIAALFAQPRQPQLADYHFFEYLKLDPDAHLDPALYPPEVVNYFNDVRARHAGQLKRMRPKKRYAVLTLLPPFGQFQNGDRVKGYVVGGLLAAFAITNITTFALQRSWCTRVTNDTTGMSSNVCDGHVEGARTARSLQITSGIGFIITYAYGVWDGVRGYRRESRERALMPYATSSNTSAVIGVHMNF